MFRVEGLLRAVLLYQALYIKQENLAQIAHWYFWYLAILHESCDVKLAFFKSKIEERIVTQWRTQKFQTSPAKHSHLAIIVKALFNPRIVTRGRTNANQNRLYWTTSIIYSREMLHVCWQPVEGGGGHCQCLSRTREAWVQIPAGWLLGQSFSLTHTYLTWFLRGWKGWQVPWNSPTPSSSEEGQDTNIIIIISLNNNGLFRRSLAFTGAYCQVSK